VERDEEFDAVLGEIVLAAFRTSGREFAEVRRLVLPLRSPEFEARVRALAGDPEPYVAARAWWVVRHYFEG
jgi:hypothetical protein